MRPSEAWSGVDRRTGVAFRPLDEHSQTDGLMRETDGFTYGARRGRRPPLVHLAGRLLPPAEARSRGSRAAGRAGLSDPVDLERFGLSSRQARGGVGAPLLRLERDRSHSWVPDERSSKSGCVPGRCAHDSLRLARPSLRSGSSKPQRIPRKQAAGLGETCSGMQKSSL